LDLFFDQMLLIIMLANVAAWTVPVLASMISLAHAATTPAYLGPNATALREHAVELMSQYPLIDCHVDLPFITRSISEYYFTL
jgi:hypothetical protein